MGTDILGRWGAVLETAVSPADLRPDGRPTDETLQRWFDEARRTYVERCLALSETIRDGRIDLVTSAFRNGPPAPLRPGAAVRIGVSATELRPSSFDMALRIRILGDGSVVADGRCTIALADASTGALLPVPAQVRRDLIALEQGASDFC